MYKRNSWRKCWMPFTKTLTGSSTNPTCLPLKEMRVTRESQSRNWQTMRGIDMCRETGASSWISFRDNLRWNVDVLSATRRCLAVLSLFFVGVGSPVPWTAGWWWCSRSIKSSSHQVLRLRSVCASTTLRVVTFCSLAVVCWFLCFNCCMLAVVCYLFDKNKKSASRYQHRGTQRGKVTSLLCVGWRMGRASINVLALFK